MDLKPSRWFLSSSPIQFVRYAALVQARAGRVLLECPPELAGLFAGMAGVNRLIVQGEVLPAFEVHAVDYLLKPVVPERFEAALDRAKERLRTKELPAPAELAATARKPGEYAERVVVKDGTRVQIIPIARLDYAESQDDYISLASQGRKYLKQQTISSLEASLNPKNFLRIHRSYLVNVERVSKLEPYTKDSHIVILNDGTRLPVSRTGYARLRALLDQQI